MKNRKRRLTSLLFSVILTATAVLDPVYANDSYPSEIYETETYDYEYDSVDPLTTESPEQQIETDSQEGAKTLADREDMEEQIETDSQQGYSDADPSGDVNGDTETLPPVEDPEKDLEDGKDGAENSETAPPANDDGNSNDGQHEEDPPSESGGENGSPSSGPEIEGGSPSAGEPGIGDPSMEEDPAGSPFVAGPDDRTTPVITVTYSGPQAYPSYYCTPPQITVTDEGGNLESISASISEFDHATNKYNETHFTDGTVDQDGRSGSITLTGTGLFTIKARDHAGNEASEEVNIDHVLGVRISTVTPPTCTEDEKSVMVYFCKACGTDYYRYEGKVTDGKKKLGHDISESPEEEKSTCGGEEGPVKVKKCKRCGLYIRVDNNEIYEDQEGDQHQWKAEPVVKNPTCTEAGYSYTECEKCGAVKDRKSILPLGHAWPMEWETPEVDNSCEGGKKTVTQTRKCTREGCEEVQTRQKEITLTHDYVRTVTKEAGCETEGRSAMVCTKCHQEQPGSEEVIPATGHKVKAGTLCTESFECEICQKTIPGKEAHKLTYVQIPGDSANHKVICANEGCAYETTAAHQKYAYGVNLCTNTDQCRECGYTIPAYDAHDLETVSDENYHWEVCKREGCQYQGPKIKHTKITTGKGSKTDCTSGQKCRDCGKVFKEAMSAHSWSEEWTTASYGHYKKCANPGCQARTLSGGHEYPSGPYDCTKGKDCSICGYKGIEAAASHAIYGTAIQGDENGHYQICQRAGCGARVEVTGVNAKHSGGEATCQAQAICEICHLPYGEKAADKHVGEEVINVREATTDQEGYTGDTICPGCKTVIRPGQQIPRLEKECSHSFEKRYDDQKCWEECTECGVIQNSVPHTLEYVGEEGGHKQQCRFCGHVTSTLEPHVPDPAKIDTNCTTALSCSLCGYEIEPALTHQYSSSFTGSATGHWRVCTNYNCSQRSPEEGHNLEGDQNCMTDDVCRDCGYVVAEKKGSHDFSGELYSDENGHYRICVNEGCSVEQREAHVPTPEDGICTTPVLCTVCSWTITEGTASHNFGGEYYTAESGHYQKCLNPGCDVRDAGNAHIGGKATCVDRAICTVCGTAYGSLDAENHTGLTEVRNYIEPTEDQEGYSGDIYCLSCAAELKKGETLPRLAEEHKHIFDVSLSDSTHHWRECRCGEREGYEPHELGDWQSDNTHHWKTCADCGKIVEGEHVYTDGVCECGARQNIHEHTYQWIVEGDSHWQKCTVCGETVNNGAHNYQWKNNADSHWMECTVCADVKDRRAHTLAWASDAVYHWQECSEPGCGYQGVKFVHEGNDDHNCETPVTCSVCEKELKPAEPHSWSDRYTFDAEHHWKECTNEDCNERSSEGIHNLIENTDCTKDVVCADCGYISVSGESTHNFQGSPYYGNADGHWQECQNGDCTVTSESSSHRGGTATCTKLAECEICHEPYGTVDSENHQGPVVLQNRKNATMTDKGYTGDKVCESCGVITEKGEEIPTLTESCTHPDLSETLFDDEVSWTQCNICGEIFDRTPHILEVRKDENGHWNQCSSCGYQTGTVPHTVEEYDNDCTTSAICTECGYEVVKASGGHRFGGTLLFDEKGHWQICQNPDCGVTSEPVSHRTSDNHDCTSPVVCVDCGHTLTAAMSSHNYSSVWTPDEDGQTHSQKCLNMGCEQARRESHLPVEDDHLCTTPIVCSICGAVTTKAEAHELGGEYDYNNTGHWQKCQRTGCVYTETEVPHSGGTATCVSQAYCVVCGQPYGDVDPETHTGKKELWNYIAPTTEREGYSGDVHCYDCGQFLEKGHVLEKVTPGHEHSFRILGSDDISHWYECACGAREGSSAHTFGAWERDAQRHSHTCTFCGHVVSAEHIFGENGECVCGMTLTVTPGNPDVTPEPSPDPEILTKVTQAEGLDDMEISEDLKEQGLDNPEAIAKELKQTVIDSGYISKEEDVAVYNVEMQVSTDGGKTWIPATQGNFPSAGLTLTIPYPAGTNGNYNFYVTHMFTHTMNGYHAGQVEVCSSVNTEEGISFTVHGLSPIAVAWTEPGVTPAPEVTPTPGETPMPEVTPTPGETPTPEVTPTPGVTPAPKPTPTPGVTPAPKPAPETKGMTMKLAETKYTYTGKVLKPKVTVYYNGKKLAGKYYTVTYKNNKKPGKATVTVKGTGKYKGYSAKTTFTISPKAVSLSSVKSSAKKKVTVKWKKGSAVTGYQIQYSTSSKFKSGNKKKTVSGATKTSVALTGLKSRKAYYVRIRAYKTSGGKKYYSAWSKKKKVTVQ